MYLLIKNDASIKGIFINKTEYKISQYADDTTLILNRSKESLLAALNVLETFGSMSGLRINTDKSKLIWIGKKRNSKDEIDVGKPLTWGKTTFNLLGVNFSVNLSEMIHINFSPIMKKLEHLFHVWNQRYLTPLGRITIIKTFALSKLNHLFLSLPSPGIVILKTIESMFFKFIWNGKLDKIKRETLTRKYLDSICSIYIILSWL